MEELSLADLMRPLKQSWLLIGAITITITVLVVAYTHMFVPTSWRTQMSIIFEESSVDALGFLQQLSPSSAFRRGGGRGDFLRVLLESRSVRGDVVDRLDLVEELEARNRPAAIRKLLDMYSIELPVSQVLILQTTWEGEPRVSTTPDDTYAAEMTAKVTKALMASLEEHLGRNDYTEAARRRKTIEEHLTRATAELREAEDALVRYATSEGLVDLSGQGRAAVDELQKLQTREDQLEANLEGARAREEAARQRLTEHDRMEISRLDESRDPAIDRLRQRVLDLQQRIAEQTEVQGKSEKHPDVASLLTDLDSAESQLAELVKADMRIDQRTQTVDPSYSTLVDEALSNSQRVSEISSSIQAVRQQKREALSRIQQFPAHATEYKRLERQVRIKGDVVSRLTDSYEKARLAEATSTTSFSVIDDAIPPIYPSGPSLKKTGAAAFVISLLLSVFIAFWIKGGAEAPPRSDEEVA